MFVWVLLSTTKIHYALIFIRHLWEAALLDLVLEYL